MQEFRLVVTVDDVILEHKICVITVVGKQCQYSTADLLKGPHKNIFGYNLLKNLNYN